jgi:hypothetical protein
MICLEQAGSPLTAGALKPWNGGNNICYWGRSNYGTMPTYAGLNDAAYFIATIDKNGTAGGPYVARLYATAEMAIADMLGEQQIMQKNRLQQGFEIYPMGLWSNTTNVRGRIGRIVDMWWSQEQTGGNNPQGAYYPDNTRTFLRIGQGVIPWDGSKFRKR